VIVRPLVEKAPFSCYNKYAFEVMPQANKVQIKEAVQGLTCVTNARNVRGRSGTREAPQHGPHLKKP
jgi:ribosomal protein L23